MKQLDTVGHNEHCMVFLAPCPAPPSAVTYSNGNASTGEPLNPRNRREWTRRAYSQATTVSDISRDIAQGLAAIRGKVVRTAANASTR
jgi:hypothetical protein